MSHTPSVKTEGARKPKFTPKAQPVKKVSTPAPDVQPAGGSSSRDGPGRGAGRGRGRGNGGASGPAGAGSGGDFDNDGRGAGRGGCGQGQGRGRGGRGASGSSGGRGNASFSGGVSFFQGTAVPVKSTGPSRSSASSGGGGGGGGGRSEDYFEPSIVKQEPSSSLHPHHRRLIRDDYGEEAGAAGDDDDDDEEPMDKFIRLQIAAELAGKGASSSSTLSSFSSVAAPVTLPMRHCNDSSSTMPPVLQSCYHAPLVKDKKGSKVADESAAALETARQLHIEHAKEAEQNDMFLLQIPSSLHLPPFSLAEYQLLQRQRLNDAGGNGAGVANAPAIPNAPSPIPPMGLPTAAESGHEAKLPPTVATPGRIGKIQIMKSGAVYLVVEQAGGTSSRFVINGGIPPSFLQTLVATTATHASMGEAANSTNGGAGAPANGPVDMFVLGNVNRKLVVSPAELFPVHR